MRFFRARPASPPPPPSVVKATGLERWRSLTLRGNVAFEQREDVRARRHYDDALAVAEELMAEAARSGEPEALSMAPLLHGIACNNIIELARIQGDRETVGLYSYRRASFLIASIESPDAPLELRSRCLLHLKVAAGSLYDYFEQGGMWDAAAAFSERANAAMFVLGQLQSAQSHTAALPAAFEQDDEDVSQVEIPRADTLNVDALHADPPRADPLHAGYGFLPGRMGSL